jgi:hypothetical protein
LTSFEITVFPCVEIEESRLAILPLPVFRF